MSDAALSSDAPTPAAWLKQSGKPWGRLIGRAALLTIADIVPAAGFAGGLALAVSGVTRSLPEAFPGLILAAASLAARGLLGQVAARAGAQAARSVKESVRRSLLSDLFEGRRGGDRAVTAAVEGIDALDGYFTRFAPARLAASVSPLIAIAIAAIASPVAAGVLIFTLLPFVLGMALVGMAAADESRRQFTAMERLSGLFLDRVRALPAILAFEAERATVSAVTTASDDLARRTSRVLRIAFLSSAVLEFFSALAVALVAVYCGFNLLRLLPFPVPEQLDLARAVFVLALAPEVYAPMRRLAAAYHERQAAESAVPSLVAAPKRQRAGRMTVTPAPAIRFDRACVAYDGGAPILRDCTLQVRPGQIIAVAGASGAGKSSLLHLLLGLAPLTGGDVLVDGMSLSRHGDFAHAIAWAGQTPTILPGTLESNIALADPHAPFRRVAEAAVRAGLSGDLGRKLDERGGGLSGGERRRLALARAILKPAPILLLDEPTANLDAHAEREMLDMIRDAARGRTTLIATHSPAVMAMADRVVRL